jgi:hypothetical protein
MVKRNPNLSTLSENYLFPEIKKRVAHFVQGHPHAPLISLGIGDTTEPLPHCIKESLVQFSEKLGSRQGYQGYGPENGLEELRRLISKKIYMEKDDKGISHGFIRNQDDRLIFIETYRFQEDLCRECRVHSPHSLLLSIHEMHYSHLGDFFDGVILYDSNHHPVMFKRYVFDTKSRQFTDLIEEQWDMEKFPLPSGSLK